MKIDNFDFDLPTERIAQQPIFPRDTAKMLVMKGGGLEHKQVLDLPDLLREGDLLVFNDTKVIPASLRGKVDNKDISINLHKQESASAWWVFARPAKHLKLGAEVIFGDGFTAKVEAEKEYGERLLRFSHIGDFWQALDKYGEMPLPPYIKRPEVDEQDKHNYQTIFAEKEGAVAAPTAGLHFTDRLLESCKQAGIDTAFVTLHVGGGTFLPVRCDDTDDHQMHSEYGEITPATCDKITATQKNGGRIVAVGTTSLRILESSAFENNGTVKPYNKDTDIFITPGFRFHVVDLLMTNFHLPKSTLFMLVSAFSGLENMRQAYETAIESHYRFFSYGDACLLERQ